MSVDLVVDRLLEADEEVTRYVKGVVPPHAQVHEVEDALRSRNFQFFKYHGVVPVLVNRWIYEKGDEFWVISPLEKSNPENKLFNIQCWRKGELIHNYTDDMQKVVAYFDRLRRG